VLAQRGELGASHKKLLCSSQMCVCVLMLESAVFEKEKEKKPPYY